MATLKRPFLLVIRDGWGRNPYPEWNHANAVHLARTPVADRLLGLTAKFVENACYQPKIGDQVGDRVRGPPINLPDDITIPPCKKEKEKNDAAKK